MSGRQGSSPPIDYLLVLRGLAACAVMLGHLPLRSGDVPVLGRWLDCTFLVRPFGYVPVLMFFALSGFLITKGFCSGRYDARTRSGVLQYLRNRSLRILPLYWVSILICAVIYLDRTVEDPRAVLGLFVFTENYRNPNLIFNSPYWTIPVEVFFYLAAPLLFAGLYGAVRRIGWLATSLAVLAAWRLYAVWCFSFFPHGEQGIQLTIQEWAYFAHDTFLFNLEAFLLGGLANFAIASPFGARVRGWTGLRAILKLAFVGGVFGLLAYGAAVSRPATQSGWLDGFTAYAMVPSVAFVVALLALLQDTASPRAPRGPFLGVRNRALRGLEWVGLISYGIYLWNVPARAALLQAGWTPADLGRIGFSAMVVAVTLVVSTASFHAIERPAFRFRTRPLESDRTLRARRGGSA